MPPSTCVAPVGEISDVANTTGRPAAASYRLQVVVWRRGAVEGDVVDDQASTGSMEVVQHVRVQGAREGIARQYTEAVVVDADDDDVGRRVLPAAQ